MEIFLLGGCDLEMLVIKKLLIKYNKPFIDKNLKWGAKLSDYNNIDFSKYTKIYGIELEKDIIPPDNYIEIDHHNQNYQKPSSLEQIADILGHKLSFFEKLVSANDKGYIKEMKKLTSKISQIKKIRKLDRLAQGSTLQDEKLAQNSVNGDFIVYSKTPFFSAVSDILVLDYNLDRYIIYNDTKVVFYGYFYKDLIKILNLSENSYYYGGGDYGFFGVKEGILNKTEIENKLKDFRMYSRHIFMYPFVVFDEFKIDETIWEKKDFKIENNLDYNKYTYFYNYVRDVLYTDDTITQYYETKETFKKYTIKLQDNKEYNLEIEKISLRKTGQIGVLTFQLKNTKYFNQTDILNINEFGRRIYPQYLGDNFDIKAPKYSFLADEICIDNKLKENFEKYTKKENLNKYIKNTLAEELPTFISYFLKGINQIESIIDDRMFVISAYKNDTISKKLSQYQNDKYNYLDDEFWYQYIFIDAPNDLTCQNKNMRKKLIKNSTYSRWIDYGTLFGISRYSFVMLSKNDCFANNVLFNHMKTMYLDMFILLLIYRAKIIYFSYEVQKIIKNSEKKSLKELKKESEMLYKKYLDFMNEMFFREITPQEQGIEIYNQTMNIMQIEKYIKDLDGDISELHEYISMKEENERNTQLEKLNKLGTLFLPPALIAGIFGMNIGNFSSTFLSFIFGFLSIIISIRLSELFLLSPEDRIFNKIFYKLLDFINLPQEKFIRFIKKYPKIETIEKSILSFVVLIVILLLSKSKKG